VTDRITAGELRALGVPVPESVPDVAGVPRNSTHVEMGDARMKGNTLKATLKYTITAPFEWIEVDFIVGEVKT
jgi:hypothetical protein